MLGSAFSDAGRRQGCGNFRNGAVMPGTDGFVVQPEHTSQLTITDDVAIADGMDQRPREAQPALSRLAVPPQPFENLVQPSDGPSGWRRPNLVMPFREILFHFLRCANQRRKSILVPPDHLGPSRSVVLWQGTARKRQGHQSPACIFEALPDLMRQPDG